MADDQAKLYATRPRNTVTPAVIPQKTTSPWLPAILFFIVTGAALAGLCYFIYIEFQGMHKQLEENQASLLEASKSFIGLDTRLKVIEESITSSDAEADQAGSSLTTKMISLEKRLSTSEKNINWNSSRFEKQDSKLKEIQNATATVNDSLGRQGTQINSQSEQITALENQLNSLSEVTSLAKKIESNSQSVSTAEQQAKRLSAAIQKVQSDTARLIRLYEKDNPSATRVH